jgi:hypothetical protein
LQPGSAIVTHSALYQEMITQLSEQVGYILHEKADQYYGEGVGFLSVKSFFNGQAHYAGNDSSDLIVNH